MSTDNTRARARCLVDGCSWSVEDTVRKADRAAEKHTREQRHSTSTSTIVGPQQRVHRIARTAAEQRLHDERNTR